MKFKATEGQAKRVAINAINASKAVGLGVCHFEDKDYFPDDLYITVEGDKKLKTIYLDYFKGRMVKLIIREIDPNVWLLKPSNKFNVNMQSFAAIYPTPEDLVKSVEGIQIISYESEGRNEDN